MQRHSNARARAASWSAVLLLCGSSSIAAAQAEDTCASHASLARLAKAPVGRLAATYDGGVMILDGRTLDVVADIPLEGFLRLNAAGDDRHIVISTDDAFRFLDIGATPGARTREQPRLYDYQIASDHPGHVTVNAEQTVLFSDGSGIAQIFPSHSIGASLPSFEQYTAPSPHHGVALALALPEGGLLVTVGTEEARSGAAVLDAERMLIASSDECPGVHGESVAADGVVALGCEDGALIYRDGEFHKVSSPDTYGRTGNHAASDHSSFILTDYKTDPDAELERTRRVSIIDVEALAMRVVELPASYSFRSLGRGPKGEALVLGTDGALRVIDPKSGEIVDHLPVVDAWEEPTDWQEPRPTLRVVEHYAYVTEPSRSTLQVIDLDAGSVVRSARLPHVPNELSGVTH